MNISKAFIAPQRARFNDLNKFFNLEDWQKEYKSCFFPNLKS